MKISCRKNEKMNHNEMEIIVHPKNMRVAKLVATQIREALGEIIVYDEYRNRYPISILSIYYIEMVDHKMFVYTEKDIYRMFFKLVNVKEILKEYNFYQINAKTLVNSKHIVKYAIGEGCRRKIYLSNGDILVSNRRYRIDFDTMIKEKAIQKIIPKRGKKV